MTKNKVSMTRKVVFRMTPQCHPELVSGSENNPQCHPDPETSSGRPSVSESD
jgi:hypothetical protein